VASLAFDIRSKKMVNMLEPAAPVIARSWDQFGVQDVARCGLRFEQIRVALIVKEALEAHGSIFAIELDLWLSESLGASCAMEPGFCSSTRASVEIMEDRRYFCLFEALRTWSGIREIRMQAGFLLALLLSLCPSFAQASGTVTNCTESALREALRGGGIVTLACNGVIVLTNTIIVAKETVLDGTGHTPTISGTGTNVFSLFWVEPGASLLLRGVAITGGSVVGSPGVHGEDGQPARGAAIFNQGSVILESCLVANHAVFGGQGDDAVLAGGRGGNGGHGLGAAIHNHGGLLYVTNSTFSGNSAAGGEGGNGASGIPAGQGGSGGRGGNGGGGAGAAIFNTAQGQVTILDSLFSSNRVTGAFAGIGGAPGGVLGVTGRNGVSGPALGAAIFNELGAVAIMNSSFVGNIGVGAEGAPGGVADLLGDGQEGSNGGEALGGGIYNESGSIMLTNCSFVENDLQGGDGGPGGAGGSSGFGREGGRGGQGGQALGGGVFNSSRGALTIVNCSFSDHGVFGGGGGVGGPGSGLARPGRAGDPGTAAGAAIFNHQGGVTILRNSILAHSVSGENASGTINDEGFNLSSDDSPILNAVGSRNRIDPLLGAFTRDGGLVPTLTLSSNSPAIDAITVPGGNNCPPFDQRRAMRVPPCDIGAYEFGGVSAQPNLLARLQDNSIALTWPISADEFVLQKATNLVHDTTWLTVTNLPSAANGWQTLMITPTNQNAFFRLIKR
jgi:hypothetical protein